MAPSSCLPALWGAFAGWSCGRVRATPAGKPFLSTLLERCLSTFMGPFYSRTWMTAEQMDRPVSLVNVIASHLENLCVCARACTHTCELMCM